jgi:hypothetical protein
VRFTGVQHRELLLVIDSMIDAYDLITQRGILSSNLSRSMGNGCLTVLRPASTTRKALSGGGAMGRALELRSRALPCRVLCDISSYECGIRRETHLRGFSVAAVTGGWCVTVTTFPCASASPGVRSCCPLAMGHALLLLGIGSGASVVACRGEGRQLGFQ